MWWGSDPFQQRFRRKLPTNNGLAAAGALPISDNDHSLQLASLTFSPVGSVRGAGGASPTDVGLAVG
jgi:hypothetical protein